MVTVVPLRAETRVKYDAYTIVKRNRANSTPCGARSVKRLPALRRGNGKRVRARTAQVEWSGSSEPSCRCGDYRIGKPVA